MKHFILRILGNTLALWVASFFVQGFHIGGGIKEYFIAGAVLGLLNMIAKPILKLISMPIIILTLGIFTLVINALMIWAVDYLFEFVKIDSLYALAYATIIVVIVNMIVSGVTKVID